MKIRGGKSSSSTNGVVVHYHGSSRKFIKKLKGFLGDGLQDSLFYSVNSRSFRKKRTPRVNLSHIDASLTELLTDQEMLFGAIGLQVLREDHFSLQISWKEEDLVSAVPQSSNPELYYEEEKVFKKPARLSKISPKKQKKQCQADGEVRAQDPNPELPAVFKSCIRELTGSTEVVFVYKKKLFKSDVNSGQNRFLIPFKQVKNDFLTEKEKEILKTNDLNITGKSAIEALLIEPSLDQSKINLKKWDMSDKSCGKTSENYVLVTTWNKVVKNNKLAEGMTVQLWSFRRGDELCFALVKEGKPRT